jgi:hypothetical protein
MGVYLMEKKVKKVNKKAPDKAKNALRSGRTDLPGCRMPGMDVFCYCFR